MGSLTSRILTILWAAFLGFAIALLGQGVWTVLLFANLATTPTIPWSVAVMAPLLLLIWLYLDGRWWPDKTSEARHRDLRANPVSGRVFAWACLAGVLSLAALVGCWIVMARLVRIPGNVLPNMSGVPLITIVLAVGMGSLISPILEQAGFWGYCQVILERKFVAVAAILITSIIYSLGPHPPTGNVLWPRLVFYFLTGLTFSVMSYLTNSNLPGLLIHILGIFIFFTLVWPGDATRRLVSAGGADLGFWIDAALAVIFAALAVLAFSRLAKLGKRKSSDGLASSNWRKERTRNKAEGR